MCGVEFLESDSFSFYYGIKNWLKSYPKIIALMGVKDSVMFCGHFINSLFSVCVSSFFHILQTQLIRFCHLRLSSEQVSDLVFSNFLPSVASLPEIFIPWLNCLIFVYLWVFFKS